MSTKGKLTRPEAVKIAGEEVVAKVEAESCDYTNRVQTDGDARIEFSSSVPFVDANGWDAQLVAFYYQTPEAIAAAGYDLSNCDWTIEGFDIC